MGGMRRWVHDLADIVLPIECLGCHRAGLAWCSDCQGAAFSLRVHRPDPAPERFPPTVAAAAYAADVREAIIGAKDRGRRDLIAPLAQFLGAAVAATGPPGERALLVPMPSSPAKARARGGEHMVRMGSVLAAQQAHVLVQALFTRSALDATTMSASARLADRQRSLGVRRGAADLLYGRRVVLIDDIVTTGATLARAAQLISGLGVSSVCAAVVAATEKEAT